MSSWTTPDLRPFPRGSGRLLFPGTSRRAALAALALYPACRPAAGAVQRAARVLVRAVGVRAFGRPVDWTPPMESGTWIRLLDGWRSVTGPFDSFAVHRRSAGDVEGFGVLLLDGGTPAAFVKLRPEAGTLDAERRALESVAHHGPIGFAVPAIIESGTEGGWNWLGIEPLPPRVHRPARRVDLQAISDEIGRVLADLPRPAGAPGSWRPMHGDLTPWNLRRLGNRVWLLDWEAAGWGPPGADRVLWEAATAALRGGRGRPTPFGEAVEFWREAVRGRGFAPRDRRLSEALDRALSGMASETT